LPVVCRERDTEYEDDDEEDKKDDDDEDDDDDVIEMPSKSRNWKSPRFVSKASSSSSSPATTSSNASSSSSSSQRASKRRNNFKVNTLPPLIRTNTGDKELTLVTIAPIAPTRLKTIGSGNGWPGDGEHGWVEGLGEDGDSDDGISPTDQLGSGKSGWAGGQMLVMLVRGEVETGKGGR
jgi:hypothetical protein